MERIIALAGRNELEKLMCRVCSSISSNDYMCYGGVNNLLVIERVKSFVCFISCDMNRSIELKEILHTIYNKGFDLVCPFSGMEKESLLISSSNV